MHTKKGMAKADALAADNLSREATRRFLNEYELAQRLGLSVQFLRKRRATLAPPRHSVFGTRVRYSIVEIEKFEAAAVQGASPPEEADARCAVERLRDTATSSRGRCSVTPSNGQVL